MTKKFNQCQTKLSALENSTLSAERYHTIMRAQQELSQQAMSAAKSQKVALDSMRHEISALSETLHCDTVTKNLNTLIKLHKLIMSHRQRNYVNKLTSRSRSIIALEDESRMMMCHQWATARECRMSRRKDQETGNACGSNRTSVKAWVEQCNKEEHLICSLHFGF
jgi:hypothetical protein